MTHRTRPLLAAVLLAAALTGCGGATTGATDPRRAARRRPRGRPRGPGDGRTPGRLPRRTRTHPLGRVDASPCCCYWAWPRTAPSRCPPVSDGDKIGSWYTKGVTPGETGPAVLIGPLRHPPAGPGVLRDVSHVRTGDEIGVTRADGASTARSSACASWSRSARRRSPPPRCTRREHHPSGAARHHLRPASSPTATAPDNIIVYADPRRLRRREAESGA
ncbi:hypothetical protein ACFSNO_24425 [Streptomyces cirratus]